MRIAALCAAALVCGCAAAPRPAGQAGGERTIEGPAGKLRVLDGGEGGLPVLFVHGMGSDLDVWRAQLRALWKTRRAAALDLRGHGGSDPPPTLDGYSVDGCAADVLAAASALGLSRFVLVGHSFGGAVITRFAGLHPERLAGLIYVDAVGDFSGLPAGVLAQLIEQNRRPQDAVAEFAAMLKEHAAPATREAVLASVARLRPGAYQALRHSLYTYAAPPDAARYQGPVAIVDAGEEVPVLAHRLWPRAPRISLQRVSHWFMLDDPAASTAALERSLSQMP